MSTWWSRRPDPEPVAPEALPEYTPTPVTLEHVQVLPRLGRGVCWSAIAAEIESEASRPDLPNPWSPDPEGDEAA